MARSMRGWLAVVLFAAVLAMVPGAARANGCDVDVLVVAGSTPPPSGDASLVGAVETYAPGCVTVVSDDAITVEMAEGADVVVVTSSVVPGLLGDRLTDAAVPMLVAEAYLFDDMGFVTPGRGSEFGSQTTIRITDPSHPLAGARAYVAPVLSVPAALNIAYDSAAPGLIPVAATGPGSPRLTLFGFEAGGELVDGIAPAGRVGFFTTYGAQLSSIGVELVVAALDWLATQPAAGCDPIPPLVPGADLSGCDLSGMDLSGVDLTGADLSGANLVGTDLTGAALSGANLTDTLVGSQEPYPCVDTLFTGADLVDADLSRMTQNHFTDLPLDDCGMYESGVSFSDADLSQATLDGARLGARNSGYDFFGSAWFGGATMQDVDFGDAFLGSSLSNVVIEGATSSGPTINGFWHVDVVDSDLSGLGVRSFSEIRDSTFTNVNLDRAGIRAEFLNVSFVGSTLRGATVISTGLGQFCGEYCTPVPRPEFDFTGVDATGAELSGDFRNTDFTGATLRGVTADSIGAICEECNASTSDWGGSLLDGVDLRDSLFGGVDFSSASMRGVDLTGAVMAEDDYWRTPTSLSGVSLLGATATPEVFETVVWSNTECPDGTNSDTNPDGTCLGNLELAPRAVMIAGNTNPPSGDLVIRDRVVAAGYDLTIVDDDSDLGALDLTGVDLLLISTSVVPTKVGDVFADIDVPVITWEGYLLDDMAMSSSGETGVTHTTITVVDPSHPLAAGLAAGNRTVYTTANRLTFGAPAPAADVVAHEPGRPARAVLFSYETGDELVDGSAAPAARIALFPNYDGVKRLSVKGIALVDAALAYAG